MGVVARALDGVNPVAMEEPEPSRPVRRYWFKAVSPNEKQRGDRIVILEMTLPWAPASWKGWMVMLGAMLLVFVTLGFTGSFLPEEIRVILSLLELAATYFVVRLTSEPLSSSRKDPPS